MPLHLSNMLHHHEEPNKRYHTDLQIFLLIWPSRDNGESFPRGCHPKVTCGRKAFCYWFIYFWLRLRQGQFQFVQCRYIVYNSECCRWQISLSWRKRDTGWRPQLHQWFLKEGKENSCTTDALFVLATTTTQPHRGGAQRRPLFEEKLIKHLGWCQLFGTRKATCFSALVTSVSAFWFRGLAQQGRSDPVGMQLNPILVATAVQLKERNTITAVSLWYFDFENKGNKNFK